MAVYKLDVVLLTSFLRKRESTFEELRVTAVMASLSNSACLTKNFGHDERRAAYRQALK